MDLPVVLAGISEVEYLALPHAISHALAIDHVDHHQGFSVVGRRIDFQDLFANAKRFPIIRELLHSLGDINPHAVRRTIVGGSNPDVLP